MYAVFLCILRVLHIFNFFTFRGTFARAWTLACGPRYCSSTVLESLRKRAHFYFRSSPHFCRRFILLFFSNEHFHISPHLTSNFHYQSINCPVPEYHPTISVLFTHTPRRKVTALVVSHVSFCVIIAFIVRPVARASLELSTHAFALHHSALITSPHVFPKFSHVQTYTHTSPHFSSSHTPGFTFSSKCQTKRQIRSRTARPAAVDTDHV